MIKIKSALLSIAVIGTLLFQVACSQSQVTVTLGLVVAASSAAVTTMESAGQLDQNTATQIIGYLNSVTSGVQYADTELSSTDTSEVKGLKIAQYFAKNVLLPNIPAGTASNIVAVINNVATSVVNFLAQVSTTTPAALKVGAKASGSVFSLTHGDMQALSRIRTADAQVQNNIVQLKSKYGIK